MDDWLNNLIYHIASGQAFFLGAGLILFGWCSSVAGKLKKLLILRNLAVFLGVILVAISATPLPYWLYGVLGFVTLFWLVLEWLKGKVNKKLHGASRFAVLFLWLMALGLEIPYHVTPSLRELGRPELFIIGDSVTAGMGDGKMVTWPRLLSRQEHLSIHDFSKMGATVGSARKQAALLQEKNGLVLLEIGGNDLLGTTSASQFEQRLDRLLAGICRQRRTVVMFELPLPPFANEFGRAQRMLAHQYGVTLVPKRIFLRVLTTSGATLDGIHLSQNGHQLMADTVWDLLRAAYGE